MDIIIVLIQVLLILLVFTAILAGFGFGMIRLRGIMEKSSLIKKHGAIKIHCPDCHTDFYSFQSIKTNIGIYPCPNCAGNKTIEKSNTK